jgi:Fic family protein
MQASATTDVAGKIRKQQNWIGGNDYNPCGAEFVPPPPDEVKDLMADLCDAVNDDTFPPVVQAALIHAQFETIHPFADGNGRTGRALIHVVLKRRGIATSYVPPVSVVLARKRKSYIAGLTGFRGDSVVPWIGQFADALAESANLARTYLDGVIRKVERWREQLRRHSAPRSDAAAWQIIDVLPAHPMITGPTAITATGRARAAVYQALGQLDQAGVLLPASESRRNQVWEAEGLLALLEGLEAGTLPPPP